MTNNAKKVRKLEKDKLMKEALEYIRNEALKPSKSIKIAKKRINRPKDLWGDWFVVSDFPPFEGVQINQIGGLGLLHAKRLYTYLGKAIDYLEQQKKGR